MARAFVLFVKFYQKISPVFFQKNCRFYPSCSQYAIISTQKYGLFKSILIIFKRILKCNPFSQGGYDPVK